MLFIFILAGCSGSKDEFAPYRKMTAKQIFNTGEKALANEDYAKAVKYFEALDAVYPFSPYTEQEQLEIIYAYYKNDDSASALASADRYIRLYPRGKHVDYAFYMKGLISFQQGYTWLQRLVGVDPSRRDLSSKKEAFLAFNQLVTYFPNSIYTPDALVRMAYIRNIIARKNVLIANYYMKRKAYVAAANRASYVIQHFNGSPEVIPALAIMVKAYRGLGLHQMANNSLHILQTSYPNAPQLKKLIRT